MPTRSMPVLLWLRRLSLTFLSMIGLLALTLGGPGAVWADPAAPSFSLQARLGVQSGDDWEPALAADRFGHVYALYKHYDIPSGQKACQRCDVHVLVQRSSDGGQTWTTPKAIAPGPVKGGQYDSQIVVDPVDGRTLWASFLQNNTSVIAVVKSTDFGETWSEPRIVSTQPPGLDKDELAVRGNTLIVAYDDDFNTFASVSLDGGEHWDSRLVFPGDAQFNISLSAGAAIDSRGNLYISWDSFDQAHSLNGDGPATLWVSRSSDHGAHWTRTVIDTSAVAPVCANCGYAFLSSQMALTVGGDDSVYLLWNGSLDQTPHAPARIFFARSANGRAYSPRAEVSDAPAGVEHAFPALTVGQSAGDVRVGWMDTRSGAWNLFYRASLDGGAHFGPLAQVSGYVPGYAYLTSAGFGLPYGDYFSMAVDQTGQTQIAWGEGPNYQGPGNIWVAHSLGR